ncbi:MAG: argininosuccinate synthase [Flavobacteriales bacterium]|jgi:argininosuccinate synthase|tara:strand:- start:12549 stop:13739 length:1191 start_codon:yes stop_codon:yes gene_type:complete
MKKVVLAYSGGLDTTYCVKYLGDLGYEVHAVLVDTGGFSEEELAFVEKRASTIGVASYKAIRVTQKFYDKCIKYLIFGNILKNNTYPLSVSAERIFQAVAIAQYAKELGADAIAHGSTGAGNDQVRFDMAFHIIYPQAEIITPIRDNNLTRQEEIDFLTKHGVEGDWSKAEYSINKGIWGTSVGGRETLTSDQFLPEDAFPSQIQKTDSEEVVLTFKEGEVVGINGEELDPVSAINKLNEIACQYGIGRDVHVGDTIVGIKGRVGFEAAAPLIIIKAHHTLEKHTLAKWQLYWKEQLANWYGNLLHEGQYLDPVMRNIETFLQDTQKYVTGTARVKLSPNHFQVLGIESKHDLMNSDAAQYGEINTLWNGDDVRGFSKIAAVPNIIFNAVNGSILD